ncbi:MAG: histidinol dehydrogenase, partial [Cyclobacteriaceae bacterium]
IEFESQSDIIDFINAYAPEHLILNTSDSDALAELIKNAGSVFLGAYTPESVGDYASGTNHTLPTNGFAKAYSGVSLSSFQKFITYQRVTLEGLKKLGPVVEEMAEAEQLIAHKRAVSIRLSEK